MLRVLVATLLLLLLATPLAASVPNPVCGAPPSPAPDPVGVEAGEVTCEDAYGSRHVRYVKLRVNDVAAAGVFLERGSHEFPTSEPGTVAEESRSAAVVVRAGAPEAGVRAGTMERAWSPYAGAARCEWSPFVAIVLPVVTEHVVSAPGVLPCEGAHRVDAMLLP